MVAAKKPTQQPLTERQNQLLRFIKAYVRHNGVSPNHREIAKAMGITSPNGVKGHLDALEAKGFINRPKRNSKLRGASRSITVVVEEGCCPTCGRKYE